MYATVMPASAVAPTISNSVSAGPVMGRLVVVEPDDVELVDELPLAKDCAACRANASLSSSSVVAFAVSVLLFGVLVVSFCVVLEFESVATCDELMGWRASHTPPTNKPVSNTPISTNPTTFPCSNRRVISHIPLWLSEIVYRIARTPAIRLYVVLWSYDYHHRYWRY